MKIAVYGTLRYGGSANGFMKGCTYHGQDRIRGRLYDLGSFPGVHRSETSAGEEVVVDVYEVPPDVLSRLDRYEGYVEGDERQSLYLRVPYETTSGIPVEIYEYNAPAGNLSRIESGDWFDARFSN